MSNDIILQKKLELSAEERIGQQGAEGVLFHVLKFLPLRKTYELRLVCKEWKVLLGSQHFQRAWVLTHVGTEPDCWLVMVRKPVGSAAFVRELVAYDTATQTWIALQHTLESACADVTSPLTRALGGASLRCVAATFTGSPFGLSLSDLDNGAPFGGVSLSNFASASAAGLVSFIVHPLKESIEPAELEILTEANICSAHNGDAHNRHAASVVVLNLLTGSYRLLPQIPVRHVNVMSREHDGFAHFSMLQVMNPANSYRIFVQCYQVQHGYNPTVQFYDSERDAWSIMDCMGTKNTTHGGIEDLVDADVLLYYPEFKRLLACNVSSGEWVRVSPAAHPVRELQRPLSRWVSGRLDMVVQYRGRVLLAAALFDEVHLRGFGVWELQERPRPEGKMEWVEVARTPYEHWQAFHARLTRSKVVHGRFRRRMADHVDIRMLSSGDLLWMTAVQFRDSNYGGTYFRPLVYNLITASWYRLPPHPRVPNEFFGAFSLHASMLACPN